MLWGGVGIFLYIGNIQIFLIIANILLGVICNKPRGRITASLVWTIKKLQLPTPFVNIILTISTYKDILLQMR